MEELVAGLLRPRLFPFGKLSKAKPAAQGLLDGISPGNGSVTGRWIRPGLRYHQQGPGHNIRWDRSGLAALAIVYNKEKEMANTGTEKEKPTPKKDTPIPKKEVRIAFAFCF